MPLVDRIRPKLPANSGGAEDFNAVKLELHKTLVDRLDFRTLENLSTDELRFELRNLLATLLETSPTPVPLNRIERERAVEEVINEVTGFGPLEPLLADPHLSDILVNTYSTVYIERRGKLERTTVHFRDNEHLLHVINRIVSRIGRRIDETSPMVDARLPDGSRVNAVIPPIAVDGPLLSIRRFGANPLRIGDLLANQSITQEMIDFLGGAVKAKLNILISGGTGGGKTTLLNILSALIPDSERIVTIEDAAELQLQQPHVCRLESRPPNIEGKGEVLARDLVRNSLRMRPDRIIVGEVRGGEVMDMLQAMNTGHEGSMATVHANSPRDAMNRVSSMVSMAEVNLSEAVMSQIISRALNIVVHVQRLTDGRRRVTNISEITGMEGNMITMQDLFMFRQRGVAADGRVMGEYVGCTVPRCLERIERAGVQLPSDTFRWRREVS